MHLKVTWLIHRLLLLSQMNLEMKASLLPFYKTKLDVHNFAIYNMASHDVTNYLWHEGEAGLTANEFASCIVHFLKANPSYEEYILWSDGCGYQNRNLLLSNALLKFATEKQKPVKQKFLERGHTQMECDSVHSVIERRLRDRDIHVPAEYAAVIRGARSNPRPYHVRYNNMDDTSTKFSTQTTGNAISPRLSGRREVSPASPLDTSSQTIKELKHKHLQELKKVLPKDFHSFYDGVDHE